MNSRHSLMVSLNGSEGNHMHANGISMELYGKGYVLGPDAGIGKTLYQGLDYLEYYSQFPSHNTVCVDGISSYPVMKSNHSFTIPSSCVPCILRLANGFLTSRFLIVKSTSANRKLLPTRPVLTELSMWVILQVIISIYSVAGK